MVQKFAQLTQLVHHYLHQYKYKDTAALHHPSVSGQQSVVQKGQIGKLCQKILKTLSRICNEMDSANEATEQLNRAERFLTEIQDNPEVITERSIRGFLYLGRTFRDRKALDSFGMIALSCISSPTKYVYFKVKDDPEAAMNIKQAETMLGTLRWGQFNNYFLLCHMKTISIMFKV